MQIIQLSAYSMHFLSTVRPGDGVGEGWGHFIKRPSFTFLPLSLSFFFLCPPARWNYNLPRRQPPPSNMTRDWPWLQPEYVVLAFGTALTAQQITARVCEVSALKFTITYLLGNLIVAVGLHMLEISGAAHPPAVTTIIGPICFQLLQLNIVFTFTFTALVIIRRLYFHPLSRFPGEKLAAISLLREAWIHYSTGKAPRHVAELHKKYGDFVRTGPNQLSVNNADILSGKHGIVRRGPWYETAVLIGTPGLSTTRNMKQHAVWRRIW